MMIHAPIGTVWQARHVGRPFLELSPPLNRRYRVYTGILLVPPINRRYKSQNAFETVPFFFENVKKKKKVFENIFLK